MNMKILSFVTPPSIYQDDMSKDNLNDIFDRAVSKSQNKYDLLDININDTNKLKDVYNLETAIKLTFSNHLQYDLHIFSRSLSRIKIQMDSKPLIFT